MSECHSWTAGWVCFANGNNVLIGGVDEGFKDGHED